MKNWLMRHNGPLQIKIKPLYSHQALVKDCKQLKMKNQWMLQKKMNLISIQYYQNSYHKSKIMNNLWVAEMRNKTEYRVCLWIMFYKIMQIKDECHSYQLSRWEWWGTVRNWRRALHLSNLKLAFYRLNILGKTSPKWNWAILAP